MSHLCSIKDVIPHWFPTVDVSRRTGYEDGGFSHASALLGPQAHARPIHPLAEPAHFLLVPYTHEWDKITLLNEDSCSFSSDYVWIFGMILRHPMSAEVVIFFFGPFIDLLIG